jgi:hypothetical protein
MRVFATLQPYDTDQCTHAGRELPSSRLGNFWKVLVGIFSQAPKLFAIDSHFKTPISHSLNNIRRHRSSRLRILMLSWE